MTMAADTMPGTKRPASTSIADRVTEQLKRDYPPGGLKWVAGLAWTGPTSVPLAQIDRTRGDTDWNAAAADKAKLQSFRKRIAAGWRKPVVLIRTPGSRLLFAMDGHTRILASTPLNVPVTAYIGTAASAHGPWEAFHSRQLASDLPALELSTAGYPSGMIKPRSGMISLDLPDGTIKPVPGGTDDHHITVVYLGEDVDDKAFAEACQRARAAAASASGPLAGKISGVSSFPGDADTVPAFAPADIPGAKPIRAQLADLSASEHKDWKPHVTLAYVPKEGPLPDPVPVTAVKFTHLSVHRGKQIARFPLGGISSEHANAGAAVELSAQTPALSTVHHPLGQPGGPGLFRVKGLMLPAYIENIARALIRSGRPESQAIQLAIGACQRWARGRGKVSPEVRAAAAKALAEWEAAKASAHAHANDGPAMELAGVFSAALHPRVAAGHGNAGQFGSQGTSLKAKPAANAGYKPAAAKPAAVQQPPPQAAPAPGQAARKKELRSQARQDRELARKITGKANALVRVRDGYIAGVLTTSGKPVAGTKATKAVSAAKSAAAKKAAATRKKNGPAKKKAKPSTRTSAQTKAANVGKMNGQIHLLRHDAKALLRSADHLDALASSL